MQLIQNKDFQFTPPKKPQAVKVISIEIRPMTYNDHEAFWNGTKFNTPDEFRERGMM